ncbi:MAG TPA: hypothetical protein DDZ05_01585 [Candidatus Blackburnbacteria bacterium]|nr:hypothetical protein [Candidatus Blackburnbacteria bacterium]
MAQEREKPRVAESISELSQRIGISVEQKTQERLNEVLASWVDARSAWEGLESFIKELEAISKQKLVQVLEAREAVVQIEARLTVTRALLSRRQDDIFPEREEIIKGRIRVLLSDAKLPFYTRPFKGLIYHFVGEPAKLHPALKSHMDAVIEADKRVGVAAKGYEEHSDRIVEGKVELRELDEKVDRARKQVVKYVVTLRPDKQQAMMLINEFPQEQDIIINAYVEQNAFSRLELANLDEFLGSTAAIKWHTLSPEQQVSWRNKKCPWAREGRVPTAQEMKASDDLIRLWKQFVRRKLLEEISS